jgi:hypothetical protein
MRRSILVAASGLALVAAMAIGPFGAAAAAPYVYGCTPATLFLSGNVPHILSLSIYDGSATSASLTIKVLSGDGHILNGDAAPLLPPLAHALPATHTFEWAWNTFGVSGETNATIASSIRIVSNVPVSATLSHDIFHDSHWTPVVCSSLQP